MWWYWWWAWVALTIIVLAIPLSLGWGRRGWGPPYPSYYRRWRTGRDRVRTGAPDPADPAAAPRSRRSAGPPEDYRYGWPADLLWICVLAAVVWVIWLWVV